MKSSRRPRRILRWVLGCILALLLAAVFYVAVILAQPQPDPNAPADMPQPLLTASPALDAARDGGEEALISAFPGPVLCAAPGSGWTLIAGTSRDAAFEGGAARVLTLTYQLPDSREVRVTSVYPARALSLLPDDGFRLTGPGPSLGGVASVCMTGGTRLRLYAQGPSGLYMAELTGSEEDSLAELLRPLTLAGGS